MCLCVCDEIYNSIYPPIMIPSIANVIHVTAATICAIMSLPVDKQPVLASVHLPSSGSRRRLMIIYLRQIERTTRKEQTKT